MNDCKCAETRKGNCESESIQFIWQRMKKPNFAPLFKNNKLHSPTFVQIWFLFCEKIVPKNRLSKIKKQLYKDKS